MTKFEEEVKETYEKVSINLYGNNAGSIGMKKLLNELKDTGLLKEQQALPVVPECVAVQIERVKNSNGNFATLGLFDSNYDKKPDYAKWIEDNINEFMVACSVGYTVEKPQLFYLKNKITGNVLVYDESPELSEVSELFATGGEFELENYTFTQQEIESMETGSYEQIEVK